MQLLTTAGSCRQSYVAPHPESCPPVGHPDIQTPGSVSEVHPGTSGAHVLRTAVLPRGVLRGRREQQHRGGSCRQKTSTRIQMAYPVGICQTAALRSHGGCCGKATKDSDMSSRL